MTTAAPDLDAMRGQLLDRVDELRTRRQSLALDAITNKRAAQQIAGVEHRLDAAEGELARLDLAQAEQERRATEAERQARQERRRAAFRAAQEKQVEREEIGARIDKAADQLVAAIVDYNTVAHAQMLLLRQAGEPQMAEAARPRPYLIHPTLARANAGKGALDLSGLPPVSPRDQHPLGERGPRPVSRPDEQQTGETE